MNSRGLRNSEINIEMEARCFRVREESRAAFHLGSSGKAMSKISKGPLDFSEREREIRRGGGVSAGGS